VEIENIISSGILELYALGHATDEQCLQVENWKATFPEVAKELNAIHVSLEKYAIGHAREVDHAVKEKIFSAIGMNRSPDKVSIKRIGTLETVCVPAAANC
jgi:hypothetical protein